MKHKTSELNGALLDAAVANVEGIEVAQCRGGYLAYAESARIHTYSAKQYSPSTDWAQGGLIIDRERISLITDDGYTEAYVRLMTNHGELAGSDGRAEGPTPLIAAMRAYVASKLGDEVDL